MVNRAPELKKLSEDIDKATNTWIKATLWLNMAFLCPFHYFFEKHDYFTEFLLSSQSTYEVQDIKLSSRTITTVHDTSEHRILGLPLGRAQLSH